MQSVADKVKLRLLSRQIAELYEETTMLRSTMGLKRLVPFLFRLFLENGFNSLS